MEFDNSISIEERFMLIFSITPFIILVFWASMRLLFGWFGFDLYYVEAGILEDILALYVLWKVGTHLINVFDK